MIEHSFIQIDSKSLPFKIEYTEEELNKISRSSLKTKDSKTNDVFTKKKPEVTFNTSCKKRLYPLGEGECLQEDVKLEAGKFAKESTFVFPKIEECTPNIFEEHMRQKIAHTEFQTYAGVVSRAYRELLEEFEKEPPSSIPRYDDFMESLLEKIEGIDTSDTVEISDKAMVCLLPKPENPELKINSEVGIPISDESTIHLLNMKKFKETVEKKEPIDAKKIFHNAVVRKRTQNNQDLKQKEDPEEVIQISHAAVMSYLNSDLKNKEANDLFREWRVSSIKQVLKSYSDNQWKGKKSFEMTSILTKREEVELNLGGYFGLECLIEEDPYEFRPLDIDPKTLSIKQTKKEPKEPKTVKGIFTSVLKPWFRSKLSSNDDDLFGDDSFS